MPPADWASVFPAFATRFAANDRLDVAAGSALAVAPDLSAFSKAS